MTCTVRHWIHSSKIYIHNWCYCANRNPKKVGVDLYHVVFQLASLLIENARSCARNCELRTPKWSLFKISWWIMWNLDYVSNQDILYSILEHRLKTISDRMWAAWHWCVCFRLPVDPPGTFDGWAGCDKTTEQTICLLSLVQTKWKLTLRSHSDLSRDWWAHLGVVVYWERSLDFVLFSMNR